MKLNFARVAVAGALFGAALSGCVVAPAPGYYADVAVTLAVAPEFALHVPGAAHFAASGVYEQERTHEMDGDSRLRARRGSGHDGSAGGAIARRQNPARQCGGQAHARKHRYLRRRT